MGQTLSEPVVEKVRAARLSQDLLPSLARLSTSPSTRIVSTANSALASLDC
jgi:hypothetical protein